MHAVKLLSLTRFVCLIAWLSMTALTAVAGNASPLRESEGSGGEIAGTVYPLSRPLSREAGEGRPIQFKPEPSMADASDVRIFVTLAVLLALLIPVLYWLKKRHPLLGITRVDSKIKVVETRAVNQRLTLHLIDVNGEEILLAQNGEQTIQLAFPSRAGRSEQCK